VGGARAGVRPRGHLQVRPRRQELRTLNIRLSFRRRKMGSGTGCRAIEPDLHPRKDDATVL